MPLETIHVALPVVLAWAALTACGGGSPAALPSPGQEKEKSRQEGKASPDAAERLLEGQLLEVSAGDLPKAMALYREIQGDEEAPPAVRARARLYLARCHRKLGEIEAARKALEALLAEPALEADVRRQARGFLTELQSGRPDNPRFDWLAELERSPEMRSRAFELAMDLASPNSETGATAQKQLIALGPVAAPVLEKLVETTRDPQHRQRLALILVHSGRFERLSLVLDPRFPPMQSAALSWGITQFYRAVPALPDEERRRLREVLEKLPSSTETDPLRDRLLIASGDRSDLAGKLARLEAFMFQQGPSRLQGGLPRGGLPLLDRQDLEALLEGDPSLTGWMARRIGEEDVKPEVRRLYFDLLLEKDPGKLGEPEWRALVATQAVTPEAYLEWLERQGKFELLAHMVAGEPGRNHVTRYFEQRYTRGARAPKEPPAAPPGWAKVLRASGYSHLLQELAESDDRAIPELLGYLQNREKEAVGPLQFPPARAEGWRPSARYLEAMGQLLDSKDPPVLQLTLEVLSQAPSEAPQALFERVEGLAASAPAPEVKGAALAALARRFQSRSETAPAFARALLAAFEQEMNEGVLPPSPQGLPRAIPSRQIRAAQQQVARAKGAGGLRVATPPRSSSLTSTLMGLQDAERLALYPHFLDLAGTEAGARFHAHYLAQWGVWPEAAPVLLDRLKSLKGKEPRESVVEYVFASQQYQPPAERLPEVLEFLKAVAGDRSLSTDTRLAALFWPTERPWDWFDWPALLGSDDPLAKALLEGRGPGEPPQSPREKLQSDFWGWVRGLPEDRQAALYRAALGSPQAEVRMAAIEAFPLSRAEAPRVLREALKDPNLQSRALYRLKNASRADLAPILLEALREHPDLRSSLIDALKRFASPEAIPVLVELLDDPDLGVRQSALEALREIRKVLEEKKEWQEMVRGLKGVPKTPPEQP